MSPRGKQADERYVSISARVPLELRKQAKHKQIDTEISTDALLEGLLRAWVNGGVVLSHQPIAPAKRTSTHGGSNPKLPTDNANELGRIRAQLGISQRAIAKALGISQSAYANYEGDKVETPEDVLTRARALLANAE